jgi:release factor glutamine methyltransferase
LSTPKQERRAPGQPGGEVRASGLVRVWTAKLAAAGIDTPKLDVELLIAFALSTDRNRLFLDDPILEPVRQVRAEALLKRRAEERIPVAQLVGERWFDGLPLEVTGSVLVPRPETELLVELAAALAPPDATVIDVGTGSGAVAIALHVRRPDLKLTASDIDNEALAVARRNINRLAHSVETQHASLLGDWRGEVVVSNPPYVEDTLRGTLAPELGHEPDHALYAGPDGLDVIRPLIVQCQAAQVGLILMEHGYNQAAPVRLLLQSAGYRPTTERDLAGQDRVTWALRDDLGPLTDEQTSALRRLR